MKSIKILIAMLFIVSFSINGYSQLWKQYSDSAKAYEDQKKKDKAIEYYTKAKEELQKDSMGTYKYAGICNNLANLYSDLRKFEMAESLYVEAKNIKEKIFGKESLVYASSCNNLAILYSDIGKYQKAEPLYIEVKNIREKILGRDDTDYASSCMNLADLFFDIYQYEKAEPLYLEAKNIREKAFGKEHPLYASSCNNLAILYEEMSQFSKAEPLYLEAKQIREKVFGKDHPTYATSCNNLAILYRKTGQYEKAELLHIEAKFIRGKVLGKMNPDNASSCNNLANLYRDMGQYKKAEPLFIEAREIWGKLFGKEHPRYALSCNNLANLYKDLGQYEKAELLYIEAKFIREKVLGKEHFDYAEACSNLAGIYLEMGQYEKAEPLYIEAKQIIEKVLGKEHPDYGSICNNLAGIYSSMYEYKKAEPLFLEAKQIWEHVYGKDDKSYATSCNNLAVNYSRLGEYNKVESLLLEAKHINEKVFGKEHPDFALSCNNLADMYMDIGQYNKAEPLLLEAKRIWEKTLGKEQANYILINNNLGSLYWNLGKIKNANTFYKEEFSTQQNNIRTTFLFTSEKERQLYLAEINNDGQELLSFTSSQNSVFSQGFSYDISLFNRNLILSSSQQLRLAIYHSTDTSIKNKYNNWINTREQISFWHSKPIADRPAYASDLEERANTLEKELTRLSSAFKNELQKKAINWKSIQQSLKTDDAAIEFVEFDYFDGKRWTDSTYYIALILRKDKPEPVLVQLFEKKQLDHLLINTENLATDKRINSLYSGNKSLYNLTWKPLEKYLNGITKVYFASAGNLFKISFAALPVNDKQVLGDKYQLVQLNTTASVVDNDQSNITASDKIQLYGGIRYDADSATLKQAVALYQSNTESSRSLPPDLERGAGFQYLPGTQKETESIKKEIGNTSIPVTILSGTNATEESVKVLTGKNSPSVLHIATHGFFFPDPKEDKRDSIQRKFETSGKAFKQSDNPLFRSGLLFAGANNAWMGKPIDGIEDGILTAYEVSNLYLPNTKLVVLSACETALGDIQGSEGVYGLQRAFKMAGVQNLVMSLWKVPDAETAEFMQIFYKNLFAKQTISNAFYNAQQVMRNKYRAEPYKWAAWVLVR